MADKGGVVGIYFMPFIGPGPGAPTVEMLMRQIDHAIKVCGVDHVGIGSDLSTAPIEETPEYLKEQKSFVEARASRGISAPDEERPLFIPELNHSRRIEGVVRGLRQRKYSGCDDREDHRRQLPQGVQGDLDDVRQEVGSRTGGRR